MWKRDGFKNVYLRKHDFEIGCPRRNCCSRAEGWMLLLTFDCTQNPIAIWNFFFLCSVFLSLVFCVAIWKRDPRVRSVLQLQNDSLPDGGGLLPIPQLVRWSRLVPTGPYHRRHYLSRCWGQRVKLWTENNNSEFEIIRLVCLFHTGSVFQVWWWRPLLCTTWCISFTSQLTSGMCVCSSLLSSHLSQPSSPLFWPKNWR